MNAKIEFFIKEVSESLVYTINGYYFFDLTSFHLVYDSDLWFDPGLIFLSEEINCRW